MINGHGHGIIISETRNAIVPSGNLCLLISLLRALACYKLYKHQVGNHINKYVST